MVRCGLREICLLWSSIVQQLSRKCGNQRNPSNPWNLHRLILGITLKIIEKTPAGSDLNERWILDSIKCLWNVLPMFYKHSSLLGSVKTCSFICKTIFKSNQGWIVGKDWFFQRLNFTKKTVRLFCGRNMKTWQKLVYGKTCKKTISYYWGFHEKGTSATCLH